MGTRTLLGVLAVGVGIVAGIGIAALDYAEATSYLSTDPKVCVNCHIMNSQYDSWQKASHHTVAICVDCHLPHEFVPKYITKAIHGWNHSKGFTLMDFDEPIRMSTLSKNALQENCLRCHSELVHAQTGGDADDAPDCRHCHHDVGHGPRAGLGGPLRENELENGQP